MHLHAHAYAEVTTAEGRTSERLSALCLETGPRRSHQRRPCVVRQPVAQPREASRDFRLFHSPPALPLVTTSVRLRRHVAEAAATEKIDSGHVAEAMGHCPRRPAEVNTSKLRLETKAGSGEWRPETVHLNAKLSDWIYRTFAEIGNRRGIAKGEFPEHTRSLRRAGSLLLAHPEHRELSHDRHHTRRR